MGLLIYMTTLWLHTPDDQLTITIHLPSHCHRFVKLDTADMDCFCIMKSGYGCLKTRQEMKKRRNLDGRVLYRPILVYLRNTDQLLQELK
jgi:hypothetical protein